MTKTKSGFTIVELLIVIVVIAILAAISIVAYNGIQNRARVSAVSSALSQSSKKIKVWQVDTPDVSPTCAQYYTIMTSRTDSTSCSFTVGEVAYQFTPGADASSYCITATSSSTSYKQTGQGQVTSGGCAGHGQGGVAAVTNLVTNPSFESNTTDWTSNGATLTRTTSEAHSGNASAQVVASPGSNNYGLTSENNMMPAQTGQTYRVSAWIKAPSGINLALRSDEYNGSTYVTGSGTTFTTTGSWQRVSVAQSINTGTQLRIYVRMNNESVSRTYYVDDVLVTLGSTLYSYADGNSPNWIWNGTANNSTSTGPAL